METLYYEAMEENARHLIGVAHQNTQLGKQIEYWHYTSANAVLAIFKDYISSVETGNTHVRCCSFLASNIRYMNDSKEFKDGVETYKDFCRDEKLIKGFQKADLLESNLDFHMDNIFLISFCGSGDLLSQWKWYGKDSGISIKFEFDKAMISTINPNSCKQNKIGSVSRQESDFVESENTERPFSFANAFPMPVKYKTQDKEKYFKRLLNTQDAQQYKQPGMIIPLAFVPLCKDIGFAEEAESRLVFFICDARKKGRYSIEYNTSERGRIKPALHVYITQPYLTTETRGVGAICRQSNDASENRNNSEGNLISQIIVGPGINQNLVFNLMIHIFDRHNYYFHDEEENEIEKKSPIPCGQLHDKIQDDLTNGYRKLHYVDWSESTNVKITSAYRKVRASYLCENGIVIMKSATPFRG